MILEQITEQLTETLKTRVLTLFGHAVDRVVLQSPPRLAMGDLATPLCLELAKALKRKPRELAESLEGPAAADVRAGGEREGAGFLNFRSTAARSRPRICKPDDADAARRPAHHRRAHQHQSEQGRPHGHLRNAVLGDTLVRCLKAWHHVETQNYR
jgi:arginyl-tRNA synthetase